MIAATADKGTAKVTGEGIDFADIISGSNVAVGKAWLRELGGISMEEAAIEGEPGYRGDARGATGTTGEGEFTEPKGA